MEEINLKTKDAEREAEVARRERNKWKEKVEKCGDLEKNIKRNLLNKVGKNARRTRDTVKLKNEKAVEFKIKKWALENDDASEMYDDKELVGYKGLSVFNGRHGRDSYEDEENVVNIIGDVMLSKEERRLLSNNPKLAVLGKVDDEMIKR